MSDTWSTPGRRHLIDEDDEKLFFSFPRTTRATQYSFISSAKNEDRMEQICTKGILARAGALATVQPHKNELYPAPEELASMIEDIAIHVDGTDRRHRPRSALDEVHNEALAFCSVSSWSDICSACGNFMLAFEGSTRYVLEQHIGTIKSADRPQP